jgi:hypothetical protein
MPNTAISQLIATNLAHLTHPGDHDNKPTPLTLPMFRPAALPPHMAEQFAADVDLPDPNIAKLTAEAIVELIETHGHTIINTTELDQLRTDAAAGIDRHRQPWIHCRCGTPLFRANIDAQRPQIDGPQLIQALTHMTPDCATKHQPTP